VEFQLRPFTAGPLVEKLSLSGFIARTAGILRIEYKVQGSLECINRPSISPVAHCRHELWRHTCFELFFGIPGEAAYWEVNLCPSGCWNLYHFDGYRTGMREESAVGPPICDIVSDTDLLSLNCTLNFNGIINSFSQLEVGVSSVVEAIGGSISYWALKHHGTAPDFHDRRSFQVLL
jgi:hypothetical protein